MTNQTASPWDSQDSSEATVSAVTAAAEAAVAAVAAVVAAAEAAVASEGAEAFATVLHPRPPTIVSPSQNSQHNVGYVIPAGNCEPGAVVDIMGENGFFLGNATVNGNNWLYTKRWPVGQYAYRVRQTSGGEYSDLSEVRRFTVVNQKDVPSIMAPSDGATYKAGPMTIIVAAHSAATAVRLLSHDDSVLGVCVKVADGVWRFTFTWTAGVKHLKAVQDLNGQPRVGSMIGFYVNP